MAFEYQVVDSELLVDGAIFGVRRDTLTMPEGGTATRDLVEHFGAVAVVAYDGRKIALVRQYRRSVDRRLWELPAGLLDIADEDPLETRTIGRSRPGGDEMVGVSRPGFQPGV